MKEIITNYKACNRKQTSQNYYQKKIIKDKKNNLTVFEPKLPIGLRPKTDAIPQS